MRLALLALPGFLAACGAPPEPPPVDPEPIVARVVATLEEAARLDKDHETAEAVRAWRRAHATFEADLEPLLRAVHPPDEVAATEYAFGCVRSEIDQARGAPAPVVRALKERLHGQIEPLLLTPPET